MTKTRRNPAAPQPLSTVLAKLSALLALAQLT
jgi:hypothetical protein